jgi:hypothetical protein
MIVNTSTGPLCKSSENLRFSSFLDSILNNCMFISSPGLGNGKLGIAIFLYNYARAASSKEYEILGDDLIEDVVNGINSSVLCDFEDGLTGIAWGIEYLTRNGFLDGNTDDILSEVDVVIKNSQNNSGREQELKINDIGFDLYSNARQKGSSVSLFDLFSFIKNKTLTDDFFKVDRMTDPSNYGLFNGMAGAGLITLYRTFYKDIYFHAIT